MLSELISGPIYLISTLLSCLPYAFQSWKKRPTDSPGIHWLCGLLIFTLVTSLGLYALALAHLVNSPLFLAFPPGLHLSLLVVITLRNRSELRSFFRQSFDSLKKARVFALSCLGSALTLVTFSSRFYPHLYDSWNYHMSIAALAVSNGGIPFHFEHPYVPSSPPFLELWKTWLWLASEHIGLLEGAQIPFAIGLAGIGYLAANKFLRCGVALSTFCGLLVLFSPKLIENATSSYLDVFTGFLLASSIFFTTLRRPLLGFLASLAAISFKYSAIGSGFLPLVLCGALLLRARRWRTVAGLCLVTPLFLSWYLHNFLKFQNPLHPYIFANTNIFLDLLRPVLPKLFTCQSSLPCWDGFYIEKIEDLRVLSGMGTGSLFAQWTAWLDMTCLSYESYLSRWGPAFSMIAMPGFLCSLAYFFSRPRLFVRKMRRPRHQLLLLATACLFFTIKPQESRISLFALPFLFAFGVFWLKIILNTFRSQRTAVVILASFVLAWAFLHAIFRQERFLEFWRSDYLNQNGAQAILFSMPHPGAEWVHALSKRAQEDCSSSPLLLDFQYELQHQYGFAPAASYAFFRKNWRLPTESVRIIESEIDRVLKGIGFDTGQCLITFQSSPLFTALNSGRNKWTQLESNAMGGLYKLTKE